MKNYFQITFKSAGLIVNLRKIKILEQILRRVIVE